MKLLDKLILAEGLPDNSKIIGKLFGKLTCASVIGYVTENSRKRHVYMFKCDCGKTHLNFARAVLSGKTKSCGCFRKETARAQGFRNTKANTDLPNLKHYYKAYVARAKQRGLQFELDLDLFRSLTSSCCHYCGTAPLNLYRGSKLTQSAAYKSNGIDRRDNHIGYTVDNVVPCCKTCNYAKHTQSYQDFIDWIIRIKNHSITE